MDDMYESRSWAEGFGYYEQLRVAVDMNDSGSWAKASKYYE